MRSRIAALVVLRLQKSDATWAELKHATSANPSHLHLVLARMQQDKIIAHEPRKGYHLSVIRNDIFKDGNRLLLSDA